MKKIFLSTLVAVLSFFAFANMFPYQYLSLKYFILNVPPIHWNGISIKYDYGMFSITDDESICFYYYKNTNDGVCIKKMNFDSLDYENSDNDEWDYFNMERFLFNSFNAIRVEKIKKNNKKYFNIIYIPDKKIAIGYLGLSENYNNYKKLMEGIKFADDIK